MMIKTKRVQDDTQWHRWWAWYPVSTPPVLKGNHYCWTRMWLGFVWRRRVQPYSWGDYWWEYRVEHPAVE